MKKIKVRLSETRKRPGRTNWNLLIDSGEKLSESKEKIRKKQLKK